MTADALGLRVLNRALLARQFLLERVKLPARNVIEHLVGMQAQIPANPYVALWSRLFDFDPAELSKLIEERRAVRGSLMRNTLHLVIVRDWFALRPMMQPVLDRTLSTSPFGPTAESIDREELLSTARRLMEDRPRTRAELGPLLQERWPHQDPQFLAYVVTHLLPLVQVTPRGLWQRTGPSAWTTPETWLGRSASSAARPDKLVMRYFAAFGPASVADVARWSRLTGLREVVEKVRPRLRVFRDEQGKELFDVPDAPRPDADTPAPPRFLPEYDNVFLSHADRTRILANADRDRGVIGKAAVLIDGFFRATWTIERKRKAATLLIDAFGKLTKVERAAVSDEGAALLTFVAGDTESRDLRFL